MKITDSLYCWLAGDDVRETIAKMGRDGLEGKSSEQLFKEFLAFGRWLDDKDN